MLYPGLYEQVINNAMNSGLADIPEARKSTAPIDTAEAAKVLAQYLTDVVQKGLENVQDNGGGIEAQIQLANQIVTTIQSTTQEAGLPVGQQRARQSQLPVGCSGWWSRSVLPAGSGLRCRLRCRVHSQGPSAPRRSDTAPAPWQPLQCR